MCITTPCFTYLRLRQQGFSLVEVLIAVGIFITTAAFMPQLFSGALRANVDAGTITWATTLAAQKIEELTAQPLLDLVGDESVDYLDRYGQPATGEEATRAYARRWRVESVPLAGAGTFAIRVEVAPYSEDDTAPAPRGMVRLATLHTQTAP
jgi:type II secretory pathway pseudopilin PulG